MTGPRPPAKAYPRRPTAHVCCERWLVGLSADQSVRVQCLARAMACRYGVRPEAPAGLPDEEHPPSRIVVLSSRTASCRASPFGPRSDTPGWWAAVAPTNFVRHHRGGAPGLPGCARHWRFASAQGMVGLRPSACLAILFGVARRKTHSSAVANTGTRRRQGDHAEPTGGGLGMRDAEVVPASRDFAGAVRTAYEPSSSESPNTYPGAGALAPSAPLSGKGPLVRVAIAFSSSDRSSGSFCARTSSVTRKPTDPSD